MLRHVLRRFADEEELLRRHRLPPAVGHVDLRPMDAVRVRLRARRLLADDFPFACERRRHVLTVHTHLYGLPVHGRTVPDRERQPHMRIRRRGRHGPPNLRRLIVHEIRPPSINGAADRDAFEDRRGRPIRDEHAAVLDERRLRRKRTRIIRFRRSVGSAELHRKEILRLLRPAPLELDRRSRRRLRLPGDLPACLHLGDERPFLHIALDRSDGRQNELRNRHSLARPNVRRIETQTKRQGGSALRHGERHIHVRKASAARRVIRKRALQDLLAGGVVPDDGVLPFFVRTHERPHRRRQHGIGVDAHLHLAVAQPLRERDPAGGRVPGRVAFRRGAADKQGRHPLEDPSWLDLETVGKIADRPILTRSDRELRNRFAPLAAGDPRGIHGHTVGLVHRRGLHGDGLRRTYPTTPAERKDKRRQQHELMHVHFNPP